MTNAVLTRFANFFLEEEHRVVFTQRQHEVEKMCLLSLQQPSFTGPMFFLREVKQHINQL